MKIAITGSSGFIGSSLVHFLEKEGHSILRLVRRTPQKDNEVYWNPDEAKSNFSPLEGIDAVVHLAGENIMKKCWSEEQKKELWKSRVDATLHLCTSLEHLKTPPRVLVAASALGYYGHRGDETLTEESPPGKGFAPKMCIAWEAATLSLANKGSRVVNMRFGIVLGKDGGTLKRVLPIFKKGLGGKLGNGRQWMSWIAIEDLDRALLHAIQTETLFGPVNAMSPNPMTNAEFTKTLGKVLHRPAIFCIPAQVLRLAIGEAADEIILASAKVWPKKLIESGFRFYRPQLESALAEVLKK
ncbi:MAG: TIGR01777 family protein [Deltaproteobacteria bacterium]|nr:TIGR01777 family protein [Deltaproteobacteria bacterium]